MGTANIDDGNHNVKFLDPRSNPNDPQYDPRFDPIDPRNDPESDLFEPSFAKYDKNDPKYKLENAIIEP